MSLREKIKQKTALIGVIGLGYVGLPLSVIKAQAGYKVIGIDLSEEQVQQVNQGISYIGDVDTPVLNELVKDQRISATTDFSVIKTVDIIIICVPTPLTVNKTPDMRYIEDAVKQVTQYLQKDQLIILESTTYPGTTDELLAPQFETSGLRAGEDFYLVFSPERVDPGNKTHTTANITKVVGGINPISTELGTLFYQQSIRNVFPVSSPRVAEMTKIFENTFRNVNIALVNELTQLCDRMGISVWEVIDAASTKGFGFMPFYPGPGLGGHCIPLDPFYLSWKAREYGIYTKFIELAGEVNDSMPHYVVQKISRILNDHQKAVKNAKILILGVAYKKDVADIRESPAVHVIKLLQQLNANVVYHDPYLPQFSEHGLTMSGVDLTDELLTSSDCVVILTNHTVFDYDHIIEHATVILDTRNATKSFPERENVVLL